MITSTDYINAEGNEVPSNTIVVYPHHRSVPDYGKYEEIIVDFRGEPKRDWFNSHFYYCLPIGMGNQYGFGIKSLYNIRAVWNGGQGADDLILNVEDYGSEQQVVATQFGSGIITIQNNFMFRTEPGVNLMTMQPPNMYIPNLMAMTGIIETDNLRRDFTFNLKIMEKDREVFIKKGDIIAAFAPIKRYFIDEFKIERGSKFFSEETFDKEEKDQDEFSRQRMNEDKARPHESGRKYYHGQHAFEGKFTEHQKRIGKNV